MPKATDIRVIKAEFKPISLVQRVPLKFGKETVSRATCARVKVTVRSADGREAQGWGETPLSAAWAWPSTLPFGQRSDAMEIFCERLADAWSDFDVTGHPIEVGQAFNLQALDALLKTSNDERCSDPKDTEALAMPHLAALICNSAFDIAMHDAFGMLVGLPIYQTYNSQFMNRDLGHYLESASGSNVSFAKRYPDEFFVLQPPLQLPAWHLVGGVDALNDSELSGNEPDDGYPVTLQGWIERDQLQALKIKLRGNDSQWDFDRLIHVGQIAQHNRVLWLTADFNCTVTDPEYVNDILDRLKSAAPRTYGMLLYVEQPFPYDLDAHPIDVHSVSSRKPLLMDESAHDWMYIKRGRELGWNGVALKTCKTQTGAILSLCWAKAHGMALMVQDLTNPSLAMIPHALLAQHAGTLFGVETNAVQFWPSASEEQRAIHPGLYDRTGGVVDLSTVTGNGFGYCIP